MQSSRSCAVSPGRSELSRRLQECLQGVSPLLCREIAGLASRGVEKTVFELTPEEEDRCGSTWKR